MARRWISRETPDRHEDPCGSLLSFEHCCELLSLNSDYEATWMLREIDECADFDTEEVHARVEFLTDNPSDDVEEEIFEGFRIVAKVGPNVDVWRGGGMTVAQPFIGCKLANPQADRRL